METCNSGLIVHVLITGALCGEVQSLEPCYIYKGKLSGQEECSFSSYILRIRTVVSLTRRIRVRVPYGDEGEDLSRQIRILLLIAGILAPLLSGE